MKRKPLAVTLIIVTIAVVSVLIGLRYLIPRPPAVILVSIDTLRPDHLGCYGYGRDTSPHLDRFAQDAIVFENCLSQAPTTRPSCGSLLTGFLPHEIKIFSNRDNLPAEVSTVAGRLKGAGYTTVGVVCNFVLRKGGGFEQGFDIYDDTMDERELVRNIPERIAERTTDMAINLLRLNKKSMYQDLSLISIHRQSVIPKCNIWILHMLQA